MIIGSIVLVLAAAGLFAAGLYHRSGSFYYSSIVLSLLAGFALVMGLRQARGRLAFPDDFDLGRDASASAGLATPQDEPLFDNGLTPRDEPGEQPLTPAEIARLARMSTAVAVVDGRPRYHLPECLHLLGRAVELVPVRDAMTAEFTPCAHCRPATHLLT